MRVPVTSGFWALTLGSIGVVFGDIGTSPLYAFREAVYRRGGAWAAGVADYRARRSLADPVGADHRRHRRNMCCCCYAPTTMARAVRSSLMALAQGALGRRSWLLLRSVSSAPRFSIGDAMITPAISVLSAVEGLKLVTPALEPYVVPLTIFILVVLFAVQSRGTARVAVASGRSWWSGSPRWRSWASSTSRDDPWFWRRSIPGYAISSCLLTERSDWSSLGAVFLAVTGGEALYADLGHFGRRPIQAGVAVSSCRRW